MRATKEKLTTATGIEPRRTRRVHKPTAKAVRVEVQQTLS